jgi:hypothetical protein
MDDKNTGPILVARCEWGARFCALAVAALGALVLAGWALDLTALKSVFPGLATMKANTALGFLVAGVSLMAAIRSRAAPGWRSVHLVLAAAVALLGSLTFGEYVLATDFGIDQLLFPGPAELAGTAPPGRMAPANAVSFMLTGVALLLLDSRRGAVGSQAAAIVDGLIGVLALLGYAYGVAALYGVGSFAKVALHSAAGFVVVNLGVLLARSQHGLMAIVTSNTVGGVMVRRARLPRPYHRTKDRSCSCSPSSFSY